MTNSSPLIHVDVQVMIMVAGVLLPIIHGIISKASTSSSVKVVLTLVLTAVASLVQMIISSEGILEASVLVVWGANLVVTIASHYGVYKPIGITGSTGKVQTITQGKGLI